MKTKVRTELPQENKNPNCSFYDPGSTLGTKAGVYGKYRFPSNTNCTAKHRRNSPARGAVIDDCTVTEPPCD
eukprot:2367817-Amphidinium_carterae.1